MSERNVAVMFCELILTETDLCYESRISELEGELLTEYDKYRKRRTAMKKTIKRLCKSKELIMMCLPGIILIIMFNYVPLGGLVLAFKKFNYADGIWKSPWIGLDNFKFLFTSASVTWRMLRNTVGYYFVFTIIGTALNVALAIGLNQCRNKYFAKASQTIMIMPAFISWIAVTFIVKALLEGQNGMLNHIITLFGGSTINWYAEAKYWPVILTIVNVWKNTGYGSILYLSALAGMDQEIFEAATLDGATKQQQIRYITLPMLTSIISIMLLLSLGGIMTSNTGLFYQVTMNVGSLYETTQTIDAYVMNALTIGTTNYGMTAAVTFFQSVVGCFMVVAVNLLVKKWDPDNSLF